jgi:hypothetical protein
MIFNSSKYFLDSSVGTQPSINNFLVSSFHNSLANQILYVKAGKNNINVEIAGKRCFHIFLLINKIDGNA